MYTIQNNQKVICKKNEGKGKKDIKMDARRRSVNKYDANKRFVTKASDDHTSEPM